jgi:xanthine dehydrogenase accessory factor
MSGFEDIARDVRRWRAAGVGAVLVRVAEYRGFGGGRRGELFAVNADGEHTGELLRGSADETVEAAVSPLLERGSGAVLAEVRVPGAQAVAAGLSCGGQATLVVANVAGIPEELWEALAERSSVAVGIRADRPDAALVVSRDGAAAGSLGDPDLDARIEDRARELLAEGVSAAEKSEEEVFLQTYHPTRRLVVVGEGELADALVQLAALLDWEARVAPELAPAERELERLGPGDCLVVLSHSAALDAPILAQAIRSAVGYVGALGSRGTQARRAGELQELGLGADEIASIYGPIGLDIRAASPAETAVAICAEILSVGAGRPPVSLRESTRPIHADG